MILSSELSGLSGIAAGQVEDPGKGDPADIRASAGRRRAADNAARFGASQLDGAPAAAGPWRGAIASAVSAETAYHAVELRRIADQWGADAGTLERYANTVDDLKRRYETLQRSLTTAAAEERTARSSYIAGNPNWYEADLAADPRYAAARERSALLRAQYQGLLAERAAADLSAVNDFTSADSRGKLSSLGSGAFTYSSLPTLSDLGKMSSLDVATLLALNPGLLEKLASAHPPESVASWWAGLEPEQQLALVTGAPSVFGALNGVAPNARVAANRINAAAELPNVRDQLAAAQAQLDAMSDGHYNLNPQREAVAALEAEAAYLERAIGGDVQLYLYNKAGDAIIEMIGDPSTATEVLSFVPGTRTQMESFYGDPMDSITGFARRQVELAPRDHSVVAFVFKDGFFPQTDNLIADGPQHNTMANSLGATYERFLAGVDVIVPERPVVSVEHSFGSAVAGAAEMHGDGVNLEARVLLAGIGMTSDWSAQEGTDYYAFQAADDMNTYFEGIESGDLGYAIRPEPSNGIQELDPELSTPFEISKFYMPAAQAARFANGLENHGLIVSPYESENRAVLFGVRDILAGERPTQ